MSGIDDSKPVTFGDLKEHCDLRCLQYNESFSRLADYMTTMAAFQVTASEMIATSAKMIVEFSKIEKIVKDHIYHDAYPPEIIGG